MRVFVSKAQSLIGYVPTTKVGGVAAAIHWYVRRVLGQ